MNYLRKFRAWCTSHPRHAVAAGVGATVFVALMAMVVIPALAAPPTSPYAPGETLNPTCAPGDTNCTVRPPITGTTTSTEILFGNGSSSAISSPNFTFTTSTGAFAITATSTFTGSVTINGLAVLTGAASTTGFTFTNATGTTITISGTASTTNLAFTNATGTNLNVSALTVTSCNGCGSVTTSSALTAGYFPYWANATGGLNGTSTLFYNTASSTVGIGTAQPSSTLHLFTSSPTLSLASTLGVDSATPGKRFDLRSGGISAASGTFDIYDFTSSTSRLVIDQTGNVGIGTTNPIALLHGSRTSGAATAMLDGYGGGVPGQYIMRGARGSQSNPSQVFSNDLIGAVSARGYGSTGFSAGDRAMIWFLATENWTDTAQGTSIRFRTTTNGGIVAANRLTIANDGNVGIGTTVPASTLHLSTSTPAISLDSTLGVGSATPGKRFDLRSGAIAAATGTFDIYDFGSSTSRLVIDRTGQVGIGTQFPSSTLHVVGNTRISGITGIGGAVPVAGVSLIVTQTSSGEGITMTKIGSAARRLNFYVGDGTAGRNDENYIQSVNTPLHFYANGDAGTMTFDGGAGASSPVLYLGGGTQSSSLFPNGVVSTAPLNAIIQGTGGSGTNIVGSSLSIVGGRGTGTGAGGAIWFDTANASTTSGSTLNVTSTKMIITQDGLVGIGTTQPSSTLHVVGNLTVTATSTFSGATVLDNASLGAMTFDSDAGQVSWIDMPVTASSSAGTVESYTAQIGGNPMFSMYSESDGIGGTVNRRIGIGTQFPSSSFHIFGNATSALISFDSTLGSGSATPGKRFDLRSGGISAASGTFDIFDFGSSTSRLVIDRTGQVGIGTAQPSSTLHVVGSGQFTGNIGSGQVPSANPGTVFAGTSADVSNLGTAVLLTNTASTGFSETRLINNVSAVGAVILYGSGVAAGTYSGPSYTALYGSGPVTMVSNVSGGFLKFMTGGSSLEAMRIDDSQRVGIGTTQPSSTLHVVGTTNLTGNANFVGVVSIGTLSQLFNGGLTTSTNDVVVGYGGQIISSTGGTNYGRLQLYNSADGSLNLQLKNGFGGNLNIQTLTNTAVVFQTNSVQRMQILGTGDISFTPPAGLGIYTTQPSSTLHLSTSSPAISIASTLGVGSATPGKRFDIRSGGISAATGTFDIFDFGSSTSRLVIDRTGQVGIGTQFPSSTLHIIGSLQVSSTGLYASSTTGNVGIGTTNPASNLEVKANNAPTITINTTNDSSLARLTFNGGNISATGINIDAGAASAAGTVLGGFSPGGLASFDVTAATQGLAMGIRSNVFMAFVTNNLERMRISAGGLLGIGTTVPSSTLHIVSSTGAVVSIQSTLGVGSATPGKRFDIRSGGIAAATGTFDIFDFVSSTSRIVVDQQGRVGINTPFPSSTLHINATCTTIATDGKCTDYAEYYPASESVEPGEVLAADPTPSSTTGLVKKATASSSDRIVGVVSSQPAVIVEGNSVQFMNGAHYTSNPLRPAVALAGRVPVKVSGENGSIAIGDFLTVSASKPGLAMKQTDPGMSIGIALEAFTPSSTQEGVITFFVKTGFAMGTLDASGTLDFAQIPTPASGPLDQFTAMIQRALYKMGLALEQGIAHLKEVFADKVTTKQLCVGATCVDEAQLRTILNNGGVSPSGAPAPTAPAPSPAPAPAPSEPAPDASSTPPADASAPADVTPPPAEPAPADVAPPAPAPEPAPTPEPVPAPAPEPAPATP